MESSFKKKDNLSKEEIIAKIEKQISISLFVQAAAEVTEAILLSRLYALKGETEGESEIVTGVWIQSIGQTIEAIAVSREIYAIDQEAIIELQKIIVSSDFLQSLGAAIEGIGGAKVLNQTTKSFIP